GTRVQVEPRREGSRRARRIREAVEAVRLDPRECLPLAERALRRRAPQLARAEAGAPPEEIARELIHSLERWLSSTNIGYRDKQRNDILIESDVDSIGGVFRVQQERDVRAKGGRVDCAKTVRAVFFFFLLGPLAAVAE